MLSHHGHRINHWECEQISEKWAEISSNQFEEDGYYQAILAANIASGIFVQSSETMRTTCRIRLMGTKVYT